MRRKGVIIILVLDQKVKVGINNTNIKHYKELGYLDIKVNDKIIINVEELTHGSEVKVKVICDYCKKEYDKMYCNHIRSKGIDACIDCQHKHSTKIKAKNYSQKYYNQIIEIFNNKNYELLSKQSELTNKTAIVRFNCSLHGYQETTVSNIIYNHGGCKKCKYMKISQSKTFTSEEVKNIIESKNENKLLNMDDYEGAYVRNLNILCGCCNERVFTTALAYYKNGKDRCDFCTGILSKSEFIITNYLENNNIKYLPQYKFDDCVDKRCLPFDFYLPTYNLCIEYDGEQHYNSHFFDTRYENSEELFNKVQHHDQIKNEYCKTYGIELLRIPYWEQDNIEQIITDKLNELDRRYSLVS